MAAFTWEFSSRYFSYSRQLGTWSNLISLCNKRGLEFAIAANQTSYEESKTESGQEGRFWRFWH